MRFQTTVNSGAVLIMLEQCARGQIHLIQIALSYCVMLLFMYSNGIELSLLLIHSAIFALCVSCLHELLVIKDTS